MSVYVIYLKDGAKMMRPVTSREEYLELRNTEEQRRTLKTVRERDPDQKTRLVQMNYSCLPNEDGSLKGSKTASMSVGMDIDFKAPEGLTAEEQQAWLKEQMAGVPELVTGKKDELGLLMLERSATKGYHLVFRRHPELSQEENLRWASRLLGVKFDDKAKDITRVFFTTTADEEELLFLDDELFSVAAWQRCSSIPAKDNFDSKALELCSLATGGTQESGNLGIFLSERRSDFPIFLNSLENITPWKIIFLRH